MKTEDIQTKKEDINTNEEVNQNKNEDKNISIERELKIFVKYVQNISKLPKTKFIIFGLGRSGSTLLVSLLNANPKIHCEGEALIHKVQNPFLFTKCRQAFSTKEVYGFKLLLYHLIDVQEIDKPAKFISRLLKEGFKLIHLKRQNILRQVLSGMYARHLGTFHMFSGNENIAKDKMTIDIDRLLNKLKSTEKKGMSEVNILRNLPHISFTYEEDLMNQESQQATVDKITEYLEIPTSEIHTDHMKIAPNRFEDFIENAEELIEVLGKTKYKEFLD